MNKTFDGHVIGEIVVDESGIYKVIDAGDEKSYSATTIMPRETFIEAYNKYIKGEAVEERPQCEWRNVVHGLLAYKACNKCNAEYPFDLTEDWILCPRCGAEIRRGGAE